MEVKMALFAFFAPIVAGLAFAVLVILLLLVRVHLPQSRWRCDHWGWHKWERKHNEDGTVAIVTDYHYSGDRRGILECPCGNWKAWGAY